MRRKGYKRVKRDYLLEINQLGLDLKFVIYCDRFSQKRYSKGLKPYSKKRMAYWFSKHQDKLLFKDFMAYLGTLKDCDVDLDS